MNVCTDQVLLKLADPAQIVGPSRHLRDALVARCAPLSDPAGFMMLVLKPDVVV